MLVPTILSLDLFWTEEGIKILEVQHGRRSGTKGYKDLFDLNLRESLANPFIKTLKKDGWEWEDDPKEFDMSIRESGHLADYIDGDFSCYQVCTNKAVQSALMPSLQSVFPKEEILTYHRDWQCMCDKIESRFKDIPEIVIKAPSQAVGHGILPMKLKNLRGYENPDWVVNDVLWHKSIFAPALTVQERIRPVPLEYKGELYEAPIRLWMALVPNGGKLEPHFFNNEPGIPAPIYYKLPTPIGSGNYESQILSDIHTGESVAPVPEHIQEQIFEQLSNCIPQAFETLMKKNYDDIVMDAFNRQDEGIGVLMFDYLLSSEHVFGVNFEGRSELLEKVRPIFKKELQNNQGFKEYFGLMLAFDTFYQKLIMDKDDKILSDGSKETYEAISQSDLMKAMDEAGFLFNIPNTPIFKKVSSSFAMQIAPCALIN